MAGTDIIGGGNVEPRALEDEMRSAYLDYAMSVIVGRALPDVRDGLKPVHRRVLYSMSEQGLGPTRPYAKSARGRRRRDGQVPPARRLGDLRHARAHGAGLLHALRARRRPGQLRLDRRRPRGRHALHRGAPHAPRDGDAARPRPGHGRLHARPTTATHQEPLVLPARFPNLLVNGSTGIAVGMATNIPPHNLREVTDAVVAYIDDPNDHRRRAHAPRQGPRLPDRRHHRRPPGHPRRLRDRPRPRARARPRGHRGDRPGQGGADRHRAALRGEEGRRHRPDHQDRRPRPRQEDPGHQRPARRVRPPRHAPGHRAQARRAARRSCSTSSTSTPRCSRPSA